MVNDKKIIRHIGKIRLHNYVINFFTANGQFIELCVTHNRSTIYEWIIEDVNGGDVSIIRKPMEYILVNTKELMRYLVEITEEKYVIDLNYEDELKTFIRLFIELTNQPMSYRNAFINAATMVKL